MNGILTEATGVSIGLVLALGGLVFGPPFLIWRWMIGTMRAAEAEARAAREAQAKEFEAKIAELHGRVSRLREEHNAFQLEVASRYASDDRLRQTEDKLTAAIGTLVSRFDAFAADFHRYVGSAAAGRRGVSP